MNWKHLFANSADVYEARPDLRRYCRDQVIAAKDRARWAARSPEVEESKRRMKAEMVEWMLVWLDDPASFPGMGSAPPPEHGINCSAV